MVGGKGVVTDKEGDCWFIRTNGCGIEKSGAANLTSSWTLNVEGSKAEVLKSSSVYDDDDPIVLRKESASSIYNIQPIVGDI